MGSGVGQERLTPPTRLLPLPPASFPVPVGVPVRLCTDLRAGGPAHLLPAPAEHMGPRPCVIRMNEQGKGGA